MLTTREVIQQNPKQYAGEQLYSTISEDVRAWFWTPCITCGMNYNPKRDGYKGSHFDQMFSYLSCGISHPQKLFQAIARIRHMKNNKQRIVHLTVNPIVVGERITQCGLDYTRWAVTKSEKTLTSIRDAMLYEGAYDPGNIEAFTELYIHHKNTESTFKTKS